VGELAATGKAVEEHLVPQLVLLLQVIEECDELLGVNAVPVLVWPFTLRIERRPYDNDVTAIRPAFHAGGPVPLAVRTVDSDDELVACVRGYRFRGIDETIHPL